MANNYQDEAIPMDVDVDVDVDYDNELSIEKPVKKQSYRKRAIPKTRVH